MKCPNCGKDMVDKSHSRLEEFWHWEDECTYYKRVKHEKFICEDCKISYKDEEWEIPSEFERPTEKQIACIAFINRQLHSNFEPVLKKDAWRFIKDNIDEAQKIKENQFEQWCEENAYWLPEYF